MFIPRDILDVHSKIYHIIPEENKNFKRELKDYIDSIWNISPEIRRSANVFILYSMILGKYIPNVNDNDISWKIKVRDIFNGNYNL